MKDAACFGDPKTNNIMKIVFDGDSITEMGRDRSNPHDMGEGFPKFASAMLQDSYPDMEFEFVNLGISGDRTEHLAARVEQLVSYEPDVAVLLIGVNDVWAYYGQGIVTTDEAFEQNYRTVLSALKERNTKIVMLQPFLLNVEDRDSMRPDLVNKQAVCKALADEYADAYLALDDLLRSQPEEPSFYAYDGIHPTADGACLIGEACLHAMEPLIQAAEDGEK